LTLSYAQQTQKKLIEEYDYPEQRRNYIYDSNGNLIEEISYSVYTPGKTLGEEYIAYRYNYMQFDQMGNWLKRYGTSYLQKEGSYSGLLGYTPSSMGYREITYLLKKVATNLGDVVDKVHFLFLTRSPICKKKAARLPSAGGGRGRR
jgi:hypothetical protein